VTLEQSLELAGHDEVAPNRVPDHALKLVVVERGGDVEDRPRVRVTRMSRWIVRTSSGCSSAV